MAQFRLAGECNQCGLCCIIGDLRCINLIMTGKPGEPMATKCAVYATRYSGMPILLLDAAGRIVAQAACGKDDVNDARAIIQRGLGKGCSLDLVVEERL